MGVKRSRDLGVWGEKKVDRTFSFTPALLSALDSLRHENRWMLKDGKGGFKLMSFSTFMELYLRRDFDELPDAYPWGGFIEQTVFTEEQKALMSEIAERNARVKAENAEYEIEFQEYLRKRRSGIEFVEKSFIDPFLTGQDDGNDFHEETTYSSFTGEEQEEEEIEDFSQGIIQRGINWLTRNSFLLNTFNGEAWEQHPEGRTIPPIAPGSIPALAPIYLVKRGKFGTKIQNLPVQNFSDNAFVQGKLKSAWAKLTSAQRLYSAEYRQNAIINRMLALSEQPPAWVEELIRDDESRIAQIHFWAIAQMGDDAELVAICWRSLKIAATKKLKLPDRPTQEVAERSKTVAGFGG
jgi:hypothetical protein